MSRYPQHVMVTGVGAPPGLGVLRSLRDCAIPLKLTAADINPLACGLSEPGADPIVLPRAGDADRYRQILREVCHQRGIDTVIPCSEAEVAALAPVALDWKRDGLNIPVPGPDTARFGIDKGLLLQRLKERGLPHPQTLLPECETDLTRWSGDFPCVLKPRSSRGARGVSYPASQDELVRTWKETRADHGDCLVQDYIPGGPDTVFTVGTLWNEGQLIARTLHRKLQTNPPSGGVAIAGETMFDADVIDAGLAILEATGPWHGLTAVELKRPGKTATPLVLEINPRMWGFGYLMTLAGLNVPELLIRMLADDLPAGHTPESLSDYHPQKMVRTWTDIPISALPEDCS